MKTQTQHHFARVLGQRPLIRGAIYARVDQLGLFVDTFGPPEVRLGKTGGTFFWNFSRYDGALGFSLVSRVTSDHKATASLGRLKVEVRLVAKTGLRFFCEWTNYRLDAVKSGEETPVVIGRVHFAVTPTHKVLAAKGHPKSITAKRIA